MTHPRNILKELGLYASRRRGQNFLTQPATARAIVAAAGVGPQDYVVEIGAGLGALTLALSEAARGVLAVEVDKGVFAALEEILSAQGPRNVQAIWTDALKLDWRETATRAGGPVVVVGNLPYSISSPLIFRLLEAMGTWQRAVILLQRELAERLAAKPGGRDYGRLSVLVQNWCEVRPDMVLGPDQFFPRPKIDSRLVILIPRDQPLAPVSLGPGGVWYQRVVGASFGQRRKTLLNSLSAGLSLERNLVDAAMKKADLPAKVRAEVLNPEDFGRLAENLRAKS
jgi:16S rRNA (adenine1518-N6/adenine1519-N6)-dimethyltransferase